MLAMFTLVFVFGVHSLIDWTWYVPGDACVALLCAGWLAGRGPLAAGAGVPARSRLAPRSSLRPMPMLVAGVVLLGTALAAWTQWQPLRSEEASQRALLLLAGNPSAAIAEARSAVDEDPLSARALIYLARIQQATGLDGVARSSLQRAVRLQPANPETWLALGEFDLRFEPREALDELGAAIYLNPESIAPGLIAEGNEEAITIQNDFLQALRTSSG
jgi:tetratricopeptide (TPR) repeat protein